MSLNNEDIATIEKLFFKAFSSIWDKNIEPTLEDMGGEIKDMNGKMEDMNGKIEELKYDVKEIKETLGDHSQELSAINRKLTAETSYRDDLEKRVQVLEKSH